MSKAPGRAEDAELSRCGGPPLETKVKASQKAKPNTASHKGHTMYEYEYAQIRSAELIRQAEQERQVREAVRSRRAARREAAARSAEHESHIPGLRRLRSNARAA